MRAYLLNLKVYESHIKSIARHLESEVCGYLAQRKGIMVEMSRGFLRLHALQEAMNSEKYKRQCLLTEETRLEKYARSISAQGSQIQDDLKIISLYNKWVKQRVKTLYESSENLHKLVSFGKRGLDCRVKELESLRMTSFNSVRKTERLESTKRQTITNAQCQASKLLQSIQQCVTRVQSANLYDDWTHEGSMKQRSNLGDTLLNLCLLQWMRLAPLLGYPEVFQYRDWINESSTEGNQRVYSHRDHAFLRGTLETLQALQCTMRQHAQLTKQAGASMVEKEDYILKLTEAQSCLDQECASLCHVCSEYDANMIRAKNLATSLVGSS